MSERNNQTDQTDDQQPSAVKPGEDEISTDELEDLEDVSGGGNGNCGCTVTT